MYPLSGLVVLPDPFVLSSPLTSPSFCGHSVHQGYDKSTLRVTLGLAGVVPEAVVEGAHQDQVGCAGFAPVKPVALPFKAAPLSVGRVPAGHARPTQRSAWRSHGPT